MRKIPDYYEDVPHELPAGGRTIVHNRVLAQWADQAPGVNGFRAWAEPRPGLAWLVWQGLAKPCECGWSGLLHYRSAPPENGPPPSVRGKRMPALFEYKSSIPTDRRVRGPAPRSEQPDGSV